jgi:hypothetical protein
LGQKIAAAQIKAYFPNNNFPDPNFIVECTGIEAKKAEKFNMDTKFL